MILDVARPIPAFRTFDYLIPDGGHSDPTYWLGRRVAIPFGRFRAVGIVCGVKEKSEISVERLKPVLSALDEEPVLTKDLIELARWLSDRYVCSFGEALFSLLPPGRDKAKPFIFNKEAGSPIKDFGDDGKTAFTLTPEQNEAIDRLKPRLSPPSYHAALLLGVAAAGKTEVYLSLAEEALKNKRNVLILAPEIGLVEQLGGMFRERFGENRVLLHHSDVTPAERIANWGSMQRGDKPIVIGPRAAVLSPLPNIGLIVVDEEQDSAFKEDRKPRFHARDVALERARREKALVVFGGATPSMELLHLAMTEQVEKVEMATRAVRASAPQIKLVDLKAQKTKGLLSPQLVEEMGNRLRQREHVILFLNKRGFFRYLRCPHCSWVARCPNCGIALVYHKGPAAPPTPGEKKGKRTRSGGYWCHYCGHTQGDIANCPQCGKKELFSGGFGTERIEAEVKEQFPWANIGRWDRDTASKRGSTKTIFADFLAGKYDILIGTQLVAQGFNFPNVTLVGVLDADGPLHIPDFRSAERAFQLISQVAGRAGRAEKPGLVLVQTRHADHYALQLAATMDIHGFYAKEKPFRDELGYPPFRHLIQVQIPGKNAEKEANALVEWGENLGLFEPVLMLGPSPVRKTRGKGELFQVLFKVALSDFPSFLGKLSARVGGSTAKMIVDVDPSSLT